VLGNWRPERSPIGEIVAGGEYYDYSAKYLDDSAQIIVPADVSGDTAVALQGAAAAAFEAIDGSGFARVDFFLTPEGRTVINEINTLPGFRPVSMFPRLWAAAGVTYRELISRIVDLAMERFGERKHRG
jgi:D-alanine-D-alanine ligase